jgi:hypothetical protein
VRLTAEAGAHWDDAIAHEWGRQFPQTPGDLNIEVVDHANNTFDTIIHFDNNNSVTVLGVPRGYPFPFRTRISLIRC